MFDSMQTHVCIPDSPSEVGQKCAGHYILQVQNATGSPVPALQHSRTIPARAVSSAKPPNFKLKGLAIGNGLVDPANQVCFEALMPYDGRLRSCNAPCKTILGRFQPFDGLLPQKAGDARHL